MKNRNNLKASVILVHGAFADASSWRKVIPLLEKDGVTVTAVQIPLKSLADDVATTKRVIDAQKEDVILVGHSYGGAVITDAAGTSCPPRTMRSTPTWSDSWRKESVLKWSRN